MSTPANQQGVRVEVRDLRKKFGDHEVLRGVSFTVERGEIFVLMGPSGSGKSVLLKHIIGLEEADGGEMLIEGHSIHAEGLRDRYRMAMVFQSGALLNSLTVGENVGLYLREHRLKPEAEIRRVVAEKLAIVGLTGAEEKNPAELSGGMKKRVAIARALVIEPQLVLYDEPTSELDPLIAITIGQEILALRDGTHATSLVVTHDRDLAFGIADRIAMIADGEILALGRPEEVRRSPHPLVQRFLTADFKPKP
ncbi:MAG: ATP-binding cassette domain-containing protein [Proteobacteria bacterium]|nr:ATP-binding cassette domain-containing protein [Verrucomicrobiota bacterium]NBU11179.1 ATP-binding cassette domain-containing protein [Pseudomonadota bacterium]